MSSKDQTNILQDLFFARVTEVGMMWKKNAVSKPAKFIAGEEKTIQNREIESYDFQTNMDQTVYKKWKDVGSFKGLCPFGGLSYPDFDTEKLQIIM